VSRRRLALGLALALPAAAPAGYVIEDVAPPPRIRPAIGALTFTPAGELVIATRDGEVWLRASDGAWRRFAAGLDEPTGLIADSARRIHVAQRPEILRAEDLDGDGAAETFSVIGGDWGLSPNYHAFFFGLARDAAGAFLGAPSLESTVTSGPEQKAAYPRLPVRGPRSLSDVLEFSGHRSETPWRGWMLRMTPNGRTEPFASGFRQANGLGLSPEGTLFATDNQGDYKPSTGLLHVAAGDFHGHPSGLKWEPGHDPAALSLEVLWRRLKTPAVVFPHGPMGQSPGQPVWDTTRGAFGPYAGQVFVGDYSRLVVRAELEEVAGTWQGACFPFLGRNDAPPHVRGARLKSGSTRAAFGPDGALYLGATAGWGAGEDGLQRVRWDGQAGFEVRSWRLTDEGFRLTFTQPADPAHLADAARFPLRRFRYLYHARYGSPRVDETPVALAALRPAADGLSVELIPRELEPGFVYELSLPELRAAQGGPLANPLAYYTLNRRRDGRGTTGGTTRLAAPGEGTRGGRESAADLRAPGALVAAGAEVYRLYCAGCHQPDGRGIPGGAANFVADRTRLAKPDRDLLALIEQGNEARAMPAFGAILSPLQRQAVLAYLRSAFGAPAP
jgi:mono/diheme cytochrome c family protein